jgi:hypothetical protein
MTDRPDCDIDDAAIISRRPGMLDSKIADELVGLHLDSGNCYGFNATATTIWTAIAAPASFAAICAVMHAEFDVDDATCRRETAALITALIREGLAEVAPAP